ncbi:hypothetical protein DP113_33765 (plasmid) [Brasilonema octagenarum UFV-E1]|uniref:NADP-dependent oxidoreductase domain-containing protein n=2 Tax=Brasilonema TaxID=383614 RepID=A0A856MQV5_9CYAN|nr:hypothetical protein [Brasilonema octagenarum UFV-OR1]QDL12694.1 hypothetical protein DP114_33655 [Brasilonema sennae CENA114]QDL19089.1 hypothetical protein DP113_33765 [Brasilonema octagenarum UFV-E1]
MPVAVFAGRVQDIVEVLDEIARNRGVTVAQVALNWLLRQPGITSVIIGARPGAATQR